ncbi:MAG: vitamin K epoxide reductase family protein [Gemmatimonadales bacterium]
MRFRQAIALLALVGLFVAIYLWLHALGVGGALKCGTGACETVQTSRWAVFLGLPVAFYGVVGYLAIFGVAIAALRPAALMQRGWGLVLLGLATVGLVFTLYLTAIELFVIHAICRWCVGSAVIITAIWAIAVWGLRSVRSLAPHTDRAASPPPRDRRA